LLDQGLAPHAAAILRRHGTDAVHVSDIGMERAEDVFILEKARDDERVCVTLDHDFHAHLAIAGHGRPSVILLRVQGLDAQGQADLIRLVYIRCEDALSEGAAVSADREPRSSVTTQVTFAGLPQLPMDRVADAIRCYASCITPSRIATVRSAKAAASGLCVIIRIVCRVRLLRSRRICSTASEFSVSKFPVGSSARRMAG
jgi:predicted nuclease of predicted toxin-antitoxin system